MTVNEGSPYAVFEEAGANGQIVSLATKPERYSWLQVARGKVTVNGQAAGQGDGVALAQEGKIEVIGVAVDLMRLWSKVAGGK